MHRPDSLSCVEAKLRMPGKIAGHLKKKIVSEVAKLAKVLESGFTQVKDAIQSLFTSKRSPSYGGNGYTAIQKHFDELGMLEVTKKTFSKGLITREVKKTVFSENGRQISFCQLSRSKSKLTKVLSTLLLKSSDQSQRTNIWPMN